MGGISSEFEISLQSGFMVLNHVPKYCNYFPIVVCQNGQWAWPKNQNNKTQYSLETLKKIWKDPTQKPNWKISNKDINSYNFPFCDLIFIALHGIWGEDGQVQKILEKYKQKFTGSSSTASKIAMDKITSKNKYYDAGILTPKFKKYNTNQAHIIQNFTFPMVVKDNYGGSSIGVYICHNIEEAHDSIKKLGSQEFFLEEFIQGREASCGFIENLDDLPPTEIKVKHNSFFDFEAKYNPKLCEEITPGQFSTELIEQMQKLAKQCHQVLKLKTYSRTDFIISPNNSIFVLETNNLPGLTKNSILPQQAKYMGLNYSQFIEHLIDISL